MNSNKRKKIFNTNKDLLQARNNIYKAQTKKVQI